MLRTDGRAGARGRTLLRREAALAAYLPREFGPGTGVASLLAELRGSRRKRDGPRRRSVVAGLRRLLRLPRAPGIRGDDRWRPPARACDGCRPADR